MMNMENGRMHNRFGNMMPRYVLSNPISNSIMYIGIRMAQSGNASRNRIRERINRFPLNGSLANE